MRTLKLGSFVKIMGTTGIVIGAFVGVAGFVLSLLGADVFIQMGGLQRLTGLIAGFVGLPLMPVVFGILGMVAALVLYLPVALVLQRFRGASPHDQ